MASKQEELHGNIALFKEILLVTKGAADLLKVAVDRGRLTAALQDLEVATKFRDHAKGMLQGESWTVGLDDSRKLDFFCEKFLTHARNTIGTNKQLSGISLAIFPHTSRTL